MTIGSNWSGLLTRGMSHLQRLVTQGFGGSTRKQDDIIRVGKPLRIKKEFEFEIYAPVEIRKEQNYDIIVPVDNRKLWEIFDAI